MDFQIGDIVTLLVRKQGTYCGFTVGDECEITDIGRSVFGISLRITIYNPITRTEDYVTTASIKLAQRRLEPLEISSKFERIQV